MWTISNIYGQLLAAIGGLECVSLYDEAMNDPNLNIYEVDEGMEEYEWETSMKNGGPCLF